MAMLLAFKMLSDAT